MWLAIVLYSMYMILKANDIISPSNMACKRSQGPETK